MHILIKSKPNIRVASRPGIFGNLKSQEIEKKIREFHEIQKSQGILLARNEYHQSFFKIHSRGEQELVPSVHISCILMDFCLRI